MKNNSVSLFFMLMGILFCTSIIISNLTAAKIITLGTITISAAVLFFPVTYILNDCIVEVWGYRKARLIIWAGFAMNFLTTGILRLAVILPAASYWPGGAHFDYIFGLAPRLAVASFAAFLAGSFINAYIMSRMKRSSQGKYFSYRAVLSTLFGEGVDSAIFFPCAYIGILPIDEMMMISATEVILKIAFEIILLPITQFTVTYIKHIEKTDVFDENVCYNPLKITDI